MSRAEDMGIDAWSEWDIYRKDEGLRNGYRITKDGIKIKLIDMTDQHLWNARNKFKDTPYFKFFDKELKNRAVEASRQW